MRNIQPQLVRLSFVHVWRSCYFFFKMVIKYCHDNTETTHNWTYSTIRWWFTQLICTYWLTFELISFTSLTDSSTRRNSKQQKSAVIKVSSRRTLVMALFASEKKLLYISLCAHTKEEAKTPKRRGEKISRQISHEMMLTGEANSTECLRREQTAEKNIVQSSECCAQASSIETSKTFDSDGISLGVGQSALCLLPPSSFYA